MLYDNSSVGNTINYIFNKLPAEDKLFVPSNPIYTDNDVVRYVRIKNLSYIVLHDYSDGRFTKYHPMNGMGISIASIETSRGKGDTDYLIKNAIADMREIYDYGSRCLVAEIDKRNSHAIDLFERNEFSLAMEDDDKVYYICYTRS